MRPIAVGEILCRFVELYVLQKSVGKALEVLLPHQLGVEVPDAALFIARACAQVERQMRSREGFGVG